jgi:hypothetical protein
MEESQKENFSKAKLVDEIFMTDKPSINVLIKVYDWKDNM